MAGIHRSESELVKFIFIFIPPARCTSGDVTLQQLVESGAHLFAPSVAGTSLSTTTAMGDASVVETLSSTMTAMGDVSVDSTPAAARLFIFAGKESKVHHQKHVHKLTAVHHGQIQLGNVHGLNTSPPICWTLHA